MNSSTDQITAYARAVTSGELTAGPHVRAACKRHLSDLERTDGLVWNLQEAEKAIRFYSSVLRLNGGEFEGQSFVLLPWQAFIIGSLFGWYTDDGTRRFRVTYIETGKGPLALDTPIATPSGWTTMGEIKVGDQVFNSRGEVTTVIATSPVFHNRDCYKLSFSDGAEIVADASHEWYTCALRNGKRPGPRKDAKKGEYERKNTLHILETIEIKKSTSKHHQARWNHRVDVAPALNLPDTQLPIGPYTFGAWLGDGDSDCARITGKDDEILEFIEAEGYLVGKRMQKPGSKAFRQAIGAKGREICRRGHAVKKGERCLACDRMSDYARRHGLPTPTITHLTLVERLREMGVLGNKHIPAQYLRAGTSQRLAILQGIMDTDGHIAENGKCEITLCHERLINDVSDLLRSLGYKCTVRESDAKLNGNTVGRRWRIGFQAYKSQPPVRLSRKFAKLADEPRTRPLCRGRMIVACDLVDSVPVRCITVASDDHMFLAGKNLVPTCNSGKSPLLAGIGIKGLVADNEPRAEIYSAATKKDQAMILFRDAVAMVDQSPGLSKRLTKSGTGERVWNLAYLQTGSFFRPISSDDGQSGPRPHIALIDEVHEHKTNTTIEMMRAGTKSRRQALICMITNSGSNKKGPGWQYHEYGAKVAAGLLQDDSFFSYICALDDDDDPFQDESCWEKVNPSLVYGLPGWKYLREQVTEARGMPSKEAIVRRLNFCQWTDAENPWISADIWLGAQREYDWRQFRGRRAWAGLDLGSTTDLTGMVLWIEPEEDGEPWRLAPFAWLPDHDLRRKEDLDRVPYLLWREKGLLETTPGKAISKLFVLRRMIEIVSIFDFQGIAYDRWRIEDLKQLAEDEGITLPEMHPFGQGFKDMSPALEAFETALLNGDVVHPGHPVFTWCASNAVAISDDAENRKLSKEKAIGRIDLMVAAVMGGGIALAKKGDGKSVYEGRGILTF